LGIKFDETVRTKELIAAFPDVNVWLVFIADDAIEDCIFIEVLFHLN